MMNGKRTRRILSVYKIVFTYDNVKKQVYPNFGHNRLTRFKAQYWEPAKWVARLRLNKMDNTVLFDTNMTAGHGGASGRFDALKKQQRNMLFFWL